MTHAHVSLVFEVLASGSCDAVWVVPCGDQRRDKACCAPAMHRLNMCRLAFEASEHSDRNCSDDGPSNIEQRPSQNSSRDHQTASPQAASQNSLTQRCVKVIDIEVSNGYVPTAGVLSLLRARYPDTEFSLLIGSDLFSQLPSWVDPQYIAATTPILVVPRGLATPEEAEQHVAPAVSSCNNQGVACSGEPKLETGCTRFSSAGFHKGVTCVACMLYLTKGWTLCRSPVTSTEARVRLATLRGRSDRCVKAVLLGIVPRSVIEYILANKLYRL